MNVLDQVITNRYALYNSDNTEVLATLPAGCVHLSVYSPPFAQDGGGSLYTYSSSERDLSNSRTYAEFMDHYEFIVRELHRITVPGRVTAVHCMDVPRDGANLNGGLMDFPGDIVRLHERIGWSYCARYHVWKEPLGVRNRTMAKGLAHRQLVEDSSLCDVASADYLLMFRRKGANPIPIAHPAGLSEYAGAREVPHELWKYRNWKGKQTENRLSHWIWRQYASAFWDDVRLDRVLPYREARDVEDERHMHPLQLDVIDRCVTLWSNPGETVLTPFMGVGSEVFSAVRMGRKGVGVELKPTYFRQAVKNMGEVDAEVKDQTLFDLLADDRDESPADEAPTKLLKVLLEVLDEPPPAVVVAEVAKPARKARKARKAKADPVPPPDLEGPTSAISWHLSGPPPVVATGDLPAIQSELPAEMVADLAKFRDPGPLEEGCRIVYRDAGGRDWAGIFRFTLGGLASLTLDRVGPATPLACAIRVDPGMVRREPTEANSVSATIAGTS